MASQPVTCDITLIGAADNTQQINLNVDESGLEGLLETDTKSDLNVSVDDLKGVFLVKFGSSGVLDETTEFAVDASSLKIHGITQFTEITNGAKVQNGKSITEDSIDMLSQRYFGNPNLAPVVFKNSNEIKYSFNVETQHKLLDSLRANLQVNGGTVNSPLKYSNNSNNYTKQILEEEILGDDNGPTLIDRIKNMPDYQDGSWNSVIFQEGDKLNISVAIGFANNLNTTNQLPQSADNALLQSVQSIVDGWQTINSLGNPITPTGPQNVFNYNPNNPDFYRLSRVSLKIVNKPVITGQPYVTITTGANDPLTLENKSITLTDNEVINASYIPSELTSTPPPTGQVTIIVNQPNMVDQATFNQYGAPIIGTVDGSGIPLQIYNITSKKNNFFAYTIDKPTSPWWPGASNAGLFQDPSKYNTSKPFNQFYFIGYISQQQINDCKICTTLGVPVTADPEDQLLAVDSNLGSVNLVDQDVYNCPYIETSLKDLSAVFTAFYSLPSYITQNALNNFLGTPGMWIDMSLNINDVLKPDYIDQENNVLAWTLDFVPDRVVFGASRRGAYTDKWDIKQSDISFNRYAAVLYRNANDDIPKPYSTLFDNTLNFYAVLPDIDWNIGYYGNQHLYILGKSTVANQKQSVTFKFDVSGNSSDISFSSLINGVTPSINVQTDQNGLQTGSLTYSWLDLSGLISDSAWTKLGVLGPASVSSMVKLDSNDPNLYLNGRDASNNLYFTSRYSVENYKSFSFTPPYNMEIDKLALYCCVPPTGEIFLLGDQRIIQELNANNKKQFFFEMTLDDFDNAPTPQGSITFDGFAFGFKENDGAGFGIFWQGDGPQINSQTWTQIGKLDLRYGKDVPLFFINDKPQNGGYNILNMYLNGENMGGKIGYTPEAGINSSAVTPYDPSGNKVYKATVDYFTSDMSSGIHDLIGPEWNNDPSNNYAIILNTNADQSVFNGRLPKLWAWNSSDFADWPGDHMPCTDSSNGVFWWVLEKKPDNGFLFVGDNDPESGGTWQTKDFMVKQLWDEYSPVVVINVIDKSEEAPFDASLNIWELSQDLQFILVDNSFADVTLDVSGSSTILLTKESNYDPLQGIWLYKMQRPPQGTILEYKWQNDDGIPESFTRSYVNQPNYYLVSYYDSSPTITYSLDFSGGEFNGAELSNNIYEIDSTTSGITSYFDNMATNQYPLTFREGGYIDVSAMSLDSSSVEININLLNQFHRLDVDISATVTSSEQNLRIPIATEFFYEFDQLRLEIPRDERVKLENLTLTTDNNPY